MSAKQAVEGQLKQHLDLIYSDIDTSQLASRILQLIEGQCVSVAEPVESYPTEADCLLISYGDSIREPGVPPLQSLKRFLDERCGKRISSLHILPFFPFSSDDGFSVIDYRQVREDLGQWSDIQSLAEDYKLMFDLVINHISSKSQWFQEYMEGKRDGYFVEATKDDDLRQVVRPRATPLLRPTQTPDGVKQVWCTFSHDQIDVNFKNPEVLLEYLDIICFYLRQGAKLVRLDAVGFLWKEAGTTCMHLSQTHEVVRLLRTVCEYVSPGTQLITETNVPNQENLTYFGNRNEAHAIYNFSLPPLLVHALLTGESKYLKQWMMSMPPAPEGCFYLNFTASHDGLGMRPAEGLLSNDEQLQMLETLRSFGGLVSTRQAADGTERVYELNVSLFEALKGTVAGEDEFQIPRFLCSQTIMLGIEGLPAFYIHSLLATPNDMEQVEATGRNRSINRHQWDQAELDRRLADSGSNQARVLRSLLERIVIRGRQPAFHPNATQFTLQLGDPFFAFWRQSQDRSQSIFAVHNLSSERQVLRLRELNLISVDTWSDLLTGEQLGGTMDDVELQPYQCLWISNQNNL